MGPGFAVGAAVGIVVRLLLLCLVVGLVLSFFDLRPIDLVYDLRGTIDSISIAASHFVRWATPHVLIGAEIVVPVALLYLLLHRRFR